METASGPHHRIALNRRAALVVVITLVVLLGCSGPGAAEPPPTPAPPSTSDVAASATAPAAATTAAPPPAAQPPGATAAPVLAPDAPIEVKVGQMLMVGVEGTTVGTDARRIVQQLRIGNVVLLDRNVQSPAQLREFTAELQALATASTGHPAIIAADQEGGTVQRLRAGFTALPDAATVGAARDAQLAFRLGSTVGYELRATGVTMALGPVLDVNDNAANPVIGRRAFGSTPARVIAAALPFAEGLRGAGVIAVAKHFPGHGSTDEDSHFALPVVRKSQDALQATEIAPFRAAVNAGVPAVMLAHVAYPALDPSGTPASVSAPIATGLLRGELGFAGVVVSDDMGMAGLLSGTTIEEASVRAVLSGSDMLICARSVMVGSCPPQSAERMRDALIGAVRDGTIPASRIDDSVRRISDLKRRYAVGEPPTMPLALVGGDAHRQAVVDILEAAAPP